MKSFKLILLFAVTVLFIAACAKNQVLTNSPANISSNNSNVPPATPNVTVNDEFAAAKITYDKKCVKCHQETGEGGKIQIDTVSLKVPNFRDPRNQDDDDEDYIEKVEKGATGKMPAFKGKLTDDEIKAVVGYIRHEFQGK